jgi:hypothetical protein
MVLPPTIPSMVQFCIAGSASPSGSEAGRLDLLSGSTWIGAARVLIF